MFIFYHILGLGILFLICYLFFNNFEESKEIRLHQKYLTEGTGKIQ